MKGELGIQAHKMGRVRECQCLNAMGLHESIGQHARGIEFGGAEYHEC